MLAQILVDVCEKTWFITSIVASIKKSPGIVAKHYTTTLSYAQAFGTYKKKACRDEFLFTHYAHRNQQMNINAKPFHFTENTILHLQECKIGNTWRAIFPIKVIIFIRSAFFFLSSKHFLDSVSTVFIHSSLKRMSSTMIKKWTHLHFSYYYSVRE